MVIHINGIKDESLTLSTVLFYVGENYKYPLLKLCTFKY